MMMKLLKQEWPVEPLAAAFQKIGLPATIRAEAVSLDQFVQLTTCIDNSEAK